MGRDWTTDLTRTLPGFDGGGHIFFALPTLTRPSETNQPTNHAQPPNPNTQVDGGGKQGRRASRANLNTYSAEEKLERRKEKARAYSAVARKRQESVSGCSSAVTCSAVQCGGVRGGGFVSCVSLFGRILVAEGGREGRKRRKDECGTPLPTTHFTLSFPFLGHDDDADHEGTTPARGVPQRLPPPHR
jgi:hypothetical protein